LRAVTLDEASRNLEGLVSRVIEDAEPAIVITNGGQQVVVLPLDDYNSWQETRYLLSNPANAARLAQSIGEAERGLATPRTLIEP